MRIAVMVAALGCLAAPAAAQSTTTLEVMANYCWGVYRVYAPNAIQDQKSLCKLHQIPEDEIICSSATKNRDRIVSNARRLQGYVLSLPENGDVSPLLYAISRGQADAETVLRGQGKELVIATLSRIFRCTAVLKRIP